MRVETDEGTRVQKDEGHHIFHIAHRFFTYDAYSTFRTCLSSFCSAISPLSHPVDAPPPRALYITFWLGGDVASISAPHYTTFPSPNFRFHTFFFPFPFFVFFLFSPPPSSRNTFSTFLFFLPPSHSNPAKTSLASSNSRRIVNLLFSDRGAMVLPYSLTQCRNPWLSPVSADVLRSWPRLTLKLKAQRSLATPMKRLRSARWMPVVIFCERCQLIFLKGSRGE